MTFSELAPKTAFVALAAALAISSTGKPGVDTAGANAQRSPVGNAAATRTVTVEDDSYSRSSLTLHKNDKITFKWGSPRHRHNVTSNSGPERFHSRTTSSDSYSYTHRFTKTGSYSLLCTQHPGQMKLAVKVKRG